MSGCSSIISVLNGLGHCVSLSSTMAYDTAIAQFNIETSTFVPNEFVPNEAVNLIYDINFGEEIKKQTHVTNGIITQKIISEDLQIGPQNKPNIRKSQSSLEARQSFNTPFTIGNKKTRKFHDKGRLITTTSAGEMAERLDFAYVLVKKVEPSQGDFLLPGWTGFNTWIIFPMFLELDTFR